MNHTVASFNAKSKGETPFTKMNKTYSNDDWYPAYLEETSKNLALVKSTCVINVQELELTELLNVFLHFKNHRLPVDSSPTPKGRSCI